MNAPISGEKINGYCRGLSRLSEFKSNLDLHKGHT